MKNYEANINSIIMKNRTNNKRNRAVDKTHVTNAINIYEENGIIIQNVC